MSQKPESNPVPAVSWHGLKQSGEDMSVRKEFISWRSILRISSPLQGFPCGSTGKESACNAGDLGSIPGMGRSLGEGKSSPLQYSGLENSVDSIVCGVAKSRTQLSNFHFKLFEVKLIKRYFFFNFH